MTDLRRALADYLTLRRGLGFALERPAKLLAQFLTHLKRQGLDTFTAEDALAWVTQPPGAGPGWLALRMSAVRGFAAYLHTLDPAFPVPPAGLFPRGRQRAVPYLYSDADITALMAAAGAMYYPRARATYQALIGLLATTGLRVGEAIRLDDADFDAEHGLITVRAGKWGKSRQVPLHPTAVAALRAYRRHRDAAHPQPATPALLVSIHGTRLCYNSVQWCFADLARRAGLHPRSAACRPRIHDLRHAFAVAALLGWYRDGGDVRTRLPLLSAYLGHSEPANTYWYLSAAPELLAEAAARLETHRGGQP